MKDIFLKFYDYMVLGTDEILKKLDTKIEGLSGRQAEERIKIYGLNQIRSNGNGLLNIFFNQVKSPFIYLLFFAALISFLIGEFRNGFLIVLFVFINIFLGFYQEAKAEHAVLLLKKYLQEKCRVLRDGKETVIDKNFLVPGDIVLLDAGDIVPADLRILQARDFLVDESVLTGESAPAIKTSILIESHSKEIFDAKNIAFAGTSVVEGEAKGVVINTAKNTVLGDITGLVSDISKESIYQKDLIKFSRLILKIVIFTMISVFLANAMIKGYTSVFDFLVFSIALVVGIIPEALPLVVSFSLSQGALKLTKQKVVVKRLSAVEDLGDVEVLCTDKTGTLTKNKLSLDKIFSSNSEKCLLFGLLNSSYIKKDFAGSRSSFDSAIFEKSSDDIFSIFKNYKLILEIPFDPVKLRSGVVVKSNDGKMFLIEKGAPESIFESVINFEDGLQKDFLFKEIESDGKNGKRTLAIAYKQLENDVDLNQIEQYEKELVFLGYFAFMDPLFDSAKETINLSKKLGIQIKVLTGDDKLVAGAISKEVGLIRDSQEVVLGESLNEISQDEFDEICKKTAVFARVSPQMKYKIVSSLEKTYEVAFLGEGINDVPALKAANVGIVVSGAVDVARDVADIVLLEKNLKVIVLGIKEGRNIFANINKYIIRTLASNFGNYYSMALISLIIPFLPMLPIQLLLLNLLSDLPLIAVATDIAHIDELKKPKLYQLNKMMILIISLAFVSTIFDFIFFGLYYKKSPEVLRTLWFIISMFTEIILVFSVRTSGIFYKAKFPSAPLTIISVLTVIITLILPFTQIGKDLFLFVTPTISQLATLFLLVIFYFGVSEIVKNAYFKYWKTINNNSH